jgi:emfourin
MKIILAQHGGLAAGILLNRPPIVVDAAALEASQAAELKALAAAAVGAPAGARSAKARDEMSYTITIEDGGHQTVLSQSDTSMTMEFAKLLAWLQQHSR